MAVGAFAREGGAFAARGGSASFGGRPAAAPATDLSGVISQLTGGSGGSKFALPGSPAYAAQVAGQSAGASSFAPPTPSAPSPSTNTAEVNPDLQYAIGQMKQRYAGDGGTGAAIDVAGGKLREFTEGQRKQAQALRARRGVTGTGIDAHDERRISGDFLNNLAGVSTDIALGRERDKDGMLNSIASGGASASSAAGASQDRAVRIWEAEQANRRAEEQSRLAQTQTILDSIFRLQSRAA